eukprot:Pgem_evm1s19769
MKFALTLITLVATASSHKLLSNNDQDSLMRERRVFEHMVVMKEIHAREQAQTQKLREQQQEEQRQINLKKQEEIQQKNAKEIAKRRTTTANDNTYKFCRNYYNNFGSHDNGNDDNTYTFCK